MHNRNIAEQAALLSWTHCAGLANSQLGQEIFSVEPASESADLRLGFDLIVRRHKRMLFVDVTNSRKYKGYKIQRAIKHAKKGHRWIYILKVDWLSATGVILDPCFNKSFDRLKDGQPAAFTQACPVHGNNCALAQKLIEFGQQINQVLTDSNTQAREFAVSLR